ncbi:MAG: phosphoribosylformylglycinamidine synthase subunit PurL [Acidobacteria bacterium]|nr:phosphoribosylformylglycinamidine synthase subunit PurL [Acidobacteriota bacterium]
MSQVTPEVVAAHSITPDEYERIVSILGRHPNLTELGIFSVMWSEHCSYKSSRVHLKKLPTRSKLVVCGPGENAGILTIGDDPDGNEWCIAFKIESHNHPSFIEPFQGAATGVGGILRDIFTMGARPIAVMDALRFGTLDDEKTGARNRRIVDGVVHGIAHYGNCFGVPTVGGETVFEASYAGNPLVNVFALGVFRRDQIFYGKACGVGNPVIYVGAKTGRDGIHGATMASGEFTEESKQKRPNVQVGDPFMEKLLLEACLEAMQTGAIAGIQDMGAAGLTCSTCEMGSRAETGIEIDLAHVPQRETGMTPYEIMLSESQERMLLVAHKGRENEVLDVFKKWGLDARIVGEVKDDGMMRVKNHGEVVAEIPSRPLADEAPVYHRPFTKPLRPEKMDAPAFASKDLTADLYTLAGSQDLCDKRWIWEQYDHMVRTNTVEGPGGDAAVMRIKETGTSVAMSLDGNGRYTYLDPRQAVKLMVAECCRNLACTGATPVGATNNLNFGNPERPEIMAQIVEAIEGMAEACEFFETPITGGNVSLYNETLGDPIYPSPVMGIVGLMKTQAPAGIAFRAAGRDLYLIGGIGEADETRMGGTQYAKQVLKDIWGLPPALDMEFEKKVQTAVREMVATAVVESAHDISDGGLAWCLAESTFGKQVGAQVDLTSGLRPELLLFHEGPSRVVVSTSNAAAVEKVAAECGVPAVKIGVTAENELVIRNSGKILIQTEVRGLKECWAGALENLLHAELHA